MSAVAAAVETFDDWITASAGVVAPPGWHLGVAYYRISDDPEHDELAVRRQRKSVRAFAEAERVVIVAEYFDDDRSAFEAKHRPGFESWLAHARRPEVDVALGWHPDRITRTPSEIERLIVDLGGDRGKPIKTVKAGRYDLATPEGRMHARISGAVAAHASEMTRERIRAKMDELADEGKWKGGRRPYGYESNGVKVIERERLVIEEAARRVLASETVRSIAADFNRREIPTAGGKAWHPGPLRNLLASPRIAGLRVHRGEVHGKAKWPAIISETTHRRLVATLNGRTPVGRRSRKAWLLTGLLVCGRCGERLSSQQDVRGVRRYICRKAPGYKGCGGLGIKAEDTEERLRQAVLKRLNTDQLAAAEDDADGEDAADLAALDAIEAKRLEHVELFNAGDETRGDYTLAMKDLDRRRREVENRMAARVRKVGPRELIAAAGAEGTPWKALTDDQKRAVLDGYLEFVKVMPATKRGSTAFEPERLKPKWRRLG